MDYEHSNLYKYIDTLQKIFYDLFYECCSEIGHEFNVLVMAETEDNRTWKYTDLESSYTTLLDSRTISKGETYIHINSNLMERIRLLRTRYCSCSRELSLPRCMGNC